MIVERLNPPSPRERLSEPLECALALARRHRMSRLRPWPGFGEPFNGQDIRRRTVELLIGQFAPGAMIETGTFMGFTTRLLAGYGIDTYTVEVSRRFRYAARFALRDLDNVTMIWGDSAAAMRRLAERGTIERPFAYLDAHWEDDLPLDAELDCLFSGWEEALVVIDDFLVPGDPGYGYDAYGGVPLSMDHVSVPDRVLVAYPKAPATEETGSRRGTGFLAAGADGRAALEAAERAGLVAIQRDR